MQPGGLCELVVFIAITDMGLLHDQQCRGLGQVAIEQFIELVACIPKGRNGSAQPDHRHDSHYQHDKSQLQGRKTAEVHAAGIFATV